jgi:hypothetical protein
MVGSVLEAPEPWGWSCGVFMDVSMMNLCRQQEFGLDYMSIPIAVNIWRMRKGAWLQAKMRQARV